MGFRDLQPSWALPLTAESLYLQPATTSLLLEPQNHSYINLYGGPLPRAPNHINLYGGPFSGPRTISIYMVVPCPGPRTISIYMVGPSPRPRTISIYMVVLGPGPRTMSIYIPMVFPYNQHETLAGCPLQPSHLQLFPPAVTENMQWRRRYRIILRQQQRRREQPTGFHRPRRGSCLAGFRGLRVSGFRGLAGFSVAGHQAKCLLNSRMPVEQ